MYIISPKKILPGAVIAMILSISPLHASAENGKCDSPPDSMNNFQPTIPYKAVSGKPFFDVNDAPRTIADYKGGGIVLNFWATWCVPCVREMPSLDRLEAKAGDLGFKVLALSEDRRGVKVIAPFYKKHNIVNLDIFVDKRGSLSGKMGARGLPTTLLIDAQGKERGRVVGAVEWDLEENARFISRCLKD